MMTRSVTHHLGKLPAREGAIRLPFKKYLTGKLPRVPANFGHETLIHSTDWGMLGNDSVGDCVIAGAMHETMLWTAEAKAQALFNDAEAIAVYGQVTGYNPADPNTDQGTDMELMAKFRRKTGFKDMAGTVHKIGAYLDLSVGDLNEHLLAAYLFSAVGIGIEFPASAMDQFNAGQPWDVVKGAKIEGGHYVPMVAKRGATLEVVTWGRLQGMTTRFFGKYNDESVVYLSSDMLVAGKTLEGFNLAQLQDDLKQITGAAATTTTTGKAEHAAADKPKSSKATA